jgi:transitional endoplasmic reticulum ATPase
MAESVLLRVAKAQSQTEVGLGRARLDMKTRKAGGRRRPDRRDHREEDDRAKVFRAQQEDEGKDIIRIDGVLRSNAGVSIGERVTVARRTPSWPARWCWRPPYRRRSG